MALRRDFSTKMVNHPSWYTLSAYSELGNSGLRDRYSARFIRRSRAVKRVSSQLLGPGRACTAGARRSLEIEGSLTAQRHASPSAQSAGSA